MLLSSAGFENPAIGNEFLQLAGKPPAEIRVLFIPTAAVSEEQLQGVTASRQELLDVGIQPEGIVYCPLDNGFEPEECKNFDVIYVCGGNTAHLLQKMMDSGFADFLKRAVMKGTLYVGVSAGSIVVGPRVGESEGLNLVDAAIMPHFKVSQQGKKELLESRGYRVVPLHDNQALRVVGNVETVIQ